MRESRTSGSVGGSLRKEAVYPTWPEPTEDQKTKIEQTAQAILDALALYPDSSLADLYDELTMPPELRTAHQKNDRAVMEAYGMPVKGTTESSCVAELMRRYQELVEKAFYELEVDKFPCIIAAAHGESMS